ncbi:proteasome activator complex subunit 4A [Galendromus occidentalis]|uniref:Proteasome activator complex subunit 4A n=1 Tax=Galendromus occidentalis TaxID=34638 RepID=A0AAJ7L5K2_9ACAR|nr:proteasome activator complex subunit 4A [Galendromus occidentalis]
MKPQDETDRSERLIKYNDLLPYADQLEDEARETFSEIKCMIASCVSEAEIRPGLITWIFHLQRYINLYGYRFSKEDHIELVRLLLDIILIPELDLGSIQVLAASVCLLLGKKTLLSPADLTVEWRPLFKLSERCARDNTEFYGLQHHTQDLDTQINSLIRACRPYFPLSATQEMLDEWLVNICPTENERDQTYRYFKHFLPTTLPPEHADKGWKLWFDRLMSVWLLDRRGKCQWILGGLLARLAEDNIGHIDWEPYLPHVFTRLLISFNLPYGSGFLKVYKFSAGSNCEIHHLTRWIVACLGGGSSAQKHLEQLFKTVESFFHPSNKGSWSGQLNKFLSRLTDLFLERLYIERYKAKSWRTPIPDSKRLSEADIDAFVDSVRPIVLTSIFSKSTALSSNKALRVLATLRPAKTIPPLVEKLNDALCNVTEPHRLLSTLNSLEFASRPLVLNHTSLSTSVDVPSLLMGCLPGIDSNDSRKTSVTFRLISSLINMMPLVDCSPIADDVAPELQQICLATSVFEDFVLELLGRCFIVIENIVAETNHQRETISSKEHDSTAMEMRLTFQAVFRQCPPCLYRSAVDKLYSFVNNRILDPVAGKMVSTIVRCAVSANPAYAVEVFLPHFSKLALTLMESDEVLKEEKLDNELVFSLIILADVALGATADALRGHATTLIRVMQRGLKLTAKLGTLTVCQILNQTLRRLVSLYPMPFGEAVTPTQLDKSDPPILHWGESSDLRTMKIDWHQASDADLAVARAIFDSCVVPEMELLDKWCSDPEANPLTKEGLSKSLCAVWSCIVGLGSSLPPLKGEPMHVTGTKTPMRFKHRQPLGQRCFDENLREDVLNLMERVMDTIFRVCEDDIRSLNTLSWTISSLVFFHGVSKADYELTFRLQKLNALILDHPLCVEDLRHIQHVVTERAWMQHKIRLNQMLPQFTSNHVRAMRILYRMAISHYSHVRCHAQESLNQFFSQYPRSYSVLLDDICGLLSSPNMTHDEYKGVLYTLLGNTHYRIFPANNWAASQKLWPALIQAPHSEKPSIICLLARLQEQLITYMDSFPMITRVPIDVIAKARRFSGDFFDPSRFPADCVESGAPNKDSYRVLVSEITELIGSGKLHWRHHFFGLVMIKMLLRDDVHYEIDTVRMVANHLISEQLRTRKICIDILAGILYQQKRKMKKIKIPRKRLEEINASIPLSPVLEKCLAGGTPRPFNTFLQFNSANHPDTQEKWDRAIFVHKPHVGFSGFKDELEVYAPDSEQPGVAKPGDMNAIEQVIYECFADSEYVTKLVNYLSIEENKDKDKVNGKRIALFKMLFRNYGDVFLENFAPFLDNHIKRSKLESEQRCALEILAGLVRGAKHWDFSMNQKLSKYVVPLMEAGSANILQETVTDWGVCVATILESRDCNKYYWFFELISRGIFDGTAFQQACKMYYLLGGVSQMSWRTMELAHRLLADITPNLAHPYHNVRHRIAHLLAYIFSCDMRKNDGQLTPFDVPENFVLSPRGMDFLTSIKQSFLCLEYNSEDQEKEVAKRLFQTVLKWQIASVGPNSSINPKEILFLLPIACRLFANTTNELLKKDCCFMVTLFGCEILSIPILQAIMDQVRQRLDESFWKVREFAISLFRFATFSNLFAISSNEKLANDVREIGLRAINDERVEVRTTAQAALSGLIHCGLIEITEDILTEVKKRLRKSSRSFKAYRQKAIESRRSNSVTNIITNNADEKKGDEINEEQKLLIDYHAAILLLCAYINAYPYDVPASMPEVVCVLADHLQAPQPISSTIKNTLSDFKRTHHDNWRDHKNKFSEEQLAVITDLLVSPSYYA